MSLPLWIRLAVVAACLCATSLVAAQTAPDGNAHPSSQIVSKGDAASQHPIGTIDWSKPGGEPAKKQAFAAKVDASPLAGVPVYHNGRVKILDTLARETVSRLTGRSRYDEPNATGKGGYKFDPLFTLLDMIIDPAYYDDKPLIHVEYLPLREKLLDTALPKQPEEQERWKKLTRLSPRLIALSGDAVANEYSLKPGYAEGLGRLQDDLMLYRSSGQNLLLVAPTTVDAPFEHVASLDPSHPARIALLELGTAWRAMDADAVNRAVEKVASALHAANENKPAGQHAHLEHLYNKAKPFEWGFWLYGVSFIVLVLAFGTQRRGLAWLGAAALVGAVGLHGFGFIARCLIAERFAIQNQFESMTGLSLFAAIVGVAIMLARRQWLFGAASAGVGFLVLIAATQTGIPGKFIEREAAILNTSVLLKYHVTTVLVSYGLISLGFILSLFYLGTHYAAKWRAAPAGLATGVTTATAGGAGTASISDVGLGLDHPVAGTARTLKDLDTAQKLVLQLAFWTLAVGILLGAWWADHSWGRFWNWDPKETWALITWFVYLVVIHVRFTDARDKGLLTAWLSVAGFAIMIWTYFGVNLLLPGLHAYA